MAARPPQRQTALDLSVRAPPPPPESKGDGSDDKQISMTAANYAKAVLAWDQGIVKCGILGGNLIALPMALESCTYAMRAAFGINRSQKPITKLTRDWMTGIKENLAAAAATPAASAAAASAIPISGRINIDAPGIGTEQYMSDRVFDDVMDKPISEYIANFEPGNPRPKRGLLYVTPVRSPPIAPSPSPFVLLAFYALRAHFLIANIYSGSSSSPTGVMSAVQSLCVDDVDRINTIARAVYVGVGRPTIETVIELISTGLFADKYEHMIGPVLRLARQELLIEGFPGMAIARGYVDCAHLMDKLTRITAEYRVYTKQDAISTAGLNKAVVGGRTTEALLLRELATTMRLCRFISLVDLYRHLSMACVNTAFLVMVTERAMDVFREYFEMAVASFAGDSLEGILITSGLLYPKGDDDVATRTSLESPLSVFVFAMATGLIPFGDIRKLAGGDTVLETILLTMKDDSGDIHQPDIPAAAIEKSHGIGASGISALVCLHTTRGLIELAPRFLGSRPAYTTPAT